MKENIKQLLFPIKRKGNAKMDLEKNKQVYNKIVNAVAQTQPERMKELIRLLEGYSGLPRVLDDFLVNMGSYNPWLATSKARLKRAIFRTPEEIKEEMRKGEKPFHGFSRTGHRLTDQIFVIAHEYNPTETLNYGAQAITKIMEAFGTPEQKEPFSPKGQERIKQKKRKQVHQTLLEIKPALEALLSPTERMHAYSVLELNELIEQKLRMLGKVMYSNKDFFDPGKNTYLLASQKGGAFSTFFERNMDRLPVGIRDAYTTLKSPFIEIDETERQKLMGSLIAYMAMKMPVNTESAVGGFKKDLEFILKDQGIRKKHGEPDLRRIREIMNKPEITLLEAAEIFNIYQFEEVRLSVNKSYLYSLKKDLDSVIEELKPYFITETGWNYESLTSVPMKKLGAKISSSALSWNDYEAIRQSMLIQTIAAYEDGFYKSQDMKGFKGLVDKVVIAKRKLDYLKARVEERKLSVKVTDDEEELVSRLKKEVLTGNDYELAENFVLKYGIALDEFMNRLFYVSIDFWKKNKKQMLAESKVGLYLNSKKRETELERLVDEAKKLIPYSEVQEDYEKAKQFIQESKLLVDKQHIALFIPPQQDYYAPGDNVKEKVAKVLRLKPKLLALEEKYKPELKKLSELHNSLLNASFYNGTALNQIRVAKEFPRDFFFEHRREFAGFEIIDAPRINNAIKRLNNTYIRADKLPEGWIEQAKYLTSFEARPQLGRINLTVSDKDTWSIIQKLKPTQDYYIQKEFVETISSIYNALFGKERKYT